MPQVGNVSEDVLRAFIALSPNDQSRVRLDTAEKVVTTAISKSQRIQDKGLVIKYSLTECYIGTQGQQKKRQEAFRAYWRLTRKVLDYRERRIIRCR